MTPSISSQEFESYVPVYDTIPENWEEGRQFLIEQLRKISNGVNIREIGWFLDEELLSGKAFIPGANTVGNSSPKQFRQILRKVVDVSPLVAGANSFNHGINFDTNFTLIDLWVCGTNSGTLTALRITGNNVVMNATQFLITSPQAFDRAFCFCEYIQEL